MFITRKMKLNNFPNDIATNTYSTILISATQLEAQKD